MKHVYLALLACATLCVQTLSADPIGSAEALRIAQQQYSMENTSVLRAGSFPEFKLAYVGTEEGIEAPSKLRSSSVENALLYLYNVGDNQGFVIVSGEDRGKQLLGIYPIRGFAEKRSVRYDGEFYAYVYPLCKGVTVRDASSGG